MRFSLRTFLIAILLLSVLLAFSIWLARGLLYGIDNFYAEWEASEMVIAYMEGHQGDWPKNWESLRPIYEARDVWSFSFEEFQELIWIDFDVDSRELRRQSLASDSTTFDVIGAVHETRLYNDPGPNETLHYYFRSREAKKTFDQKTIQVVNP